MSSENTAPIVWAAGPGQQDPDYGKVVDGLNCCIYADRTVYCPDDCPYQDKDGLRCETVLKQDALVLIQQQAQAIYELRKNMDRFKITVKEDMAHGGT